MQFSLENTLLLIPGNITPKWRCKN
ncbi:hypothetical protein YPPY61_4270, partial [Yersinia pestis PY-61]